MRTIILCGVLVVCASLLEAQDKAEAPKPVPPPPGAKVLFNGVDLAGWVGRGGKPAQWVVKDGYVECKPRTGDILTKDTFGPDFQLHVEFWLPLMADQKGQGRSNSGVYLQGRYEIQVLDSYPPGENGTKGSCAALYGIFAPSMNASKPPEQWQTYDITFYAPRVDANGKVTKKGMVTVVHNGVTVIDKGEFDKVTGGALDDKMGEPGPIRLQDHGNHVRYRNIWLKPL